MTDILRVTYDQSGRSKAENPMGMRQMQERVFRDRGAQYLLLKAPPASGKSRALMFIGLDKLENQGVRKVIVAVPERSIGGSFANSKLSEKGFFRDWAVEPRYDLCSGDSDLSQGKVDRFREFMASPAQILICTHATLRFAFDKMRAADFDNCLVAVDEFHHASASEDSRLGEVIRALMDRDQAHIMAMTGSYFRGDTLAVMRAEDEARFTRVTYSYFEQLNGYEFLRSLGIGYHFYRGVYLDALMEVLDTNSLTILHIPNVNASESTKDKRAEVDRILSMIGVYQHADPDTGFLIVKRHADGRMLKIADLVDDNPDRRPKVVSSLRGIKAKEDLDLIIALGMAKEGFDWPFCEVALTVGYRNSLTEIIQIIGRATRDAPGKPHAQFINLIAEPDASEETVTRAVNDMLKAISASLLMEQVLAPRFAFFTRSRAVEGSDGEEDGGEQAPQPSFDFDAQTGTITIGIRNLKEPSTARVREIVEQDMTDLVATVAQDSRIVQAGLDPSVPPEVINQVHIPRIIESRYGDLGLEEQEEVRQQLVARMAILASTRGMAEEGEAFDNSGNTKFVDLTRRFINIQDLDIDLIDHISPFQQAYEVISRAVDAPLLGRILGVIASLRSNMSEEEARALWPRIQAFQAEHGRAPLAASFDALEARLAIALEWLRREFARRQAATQEG